MKSSNIPEVKLGIIAVSRDCFPIALSEKESADLRKSADTLRGILDECGI